ncbi:hypothetical protein SAMN05444266_107207 [Chitinophaga jiangningensis]|uniref:Uncharacterized protein n=1 Tax=Chitinophaga jiangningensis TaxID=1419482 RepID=A0A1M7HEH1_9BACT|nr:hypothetical protein [Chitinophaga jiangningensis]SHM26931.1 hypothetical protein SAMN05444266_107207 [Chitinophaga jiangningensis]
MKETFLSPIAYTTYAFITLMLLRFLLNIYNLRQTSSLLKKYNHYLAKNTWEFNQEVPAIIDLFKKAGIKDSGVTHQEFLGFGNFANYRVSTFDNITNTRSDIVAHTIGHFNQAIGVFRKRATDSLNPLYWIDFILCLPQHLLSFLGVLPESVVVKIILVIYWIIAMVLGLEKLDVINIVKSFK